VQTNLSAFSKDPDPKRIRNDSYETRRPEKTVLYRIVSEYWPEFRERAMEEGGLPVFVENEFEEYLTCGIPEYGLARFMCGVCGHEMVVAYSCKRRGFCPSCIGRRMSDMAVHMVEDVLPKVPLRHWICSLPWRLRGPVGFDRHLCTDVLDAFISSMNRSLRRRAGKALGLHSIKQAITGSITFIQRGDSALRLNPHFHTVALDGVYVRNNEGVLHFHALDPPTREDIAQVAVWTYEKLVRALLNHGRSLEGLDYIPDAFGIEQPVLSSCYGASAADIQLLGEHPGSRVEKISRTDLHVPESSYACAEAGGINIHAAVSIDGRNRERVEKLIRYLARPPLSQERLSQLSDGKVRYDFKSAWKDGTSAVVLHPLDFIARLSALIPPPRFHTLRYHGCFAPHSKVRSEVVPGVSTEGGIQISLFQEPESNSLDEVPVVRKKKRTFRYPWAFLLRRVFNAEVEICPLCSGRMRLVQTSDDPSEIAHVIETRSPGPDPPVRNNLTLRGQLELAFV
jgi:hypothetical protein